jgi:integrase
VSPAWIRPRVNSDGSRSFQVLYRRGGRHHPVRHAGAFRGWPGGRDKVGRPKPAVTAAEREARTRRDLIAGWIAQGLDPRVELARMNMPVAKPRTLGEQFVEYEKSRIDVGEKAIEAYRQTRRRLAWLGTMFPEDIRPEHVQRWIAEQSDLAPASVVKYVGPIRLVLDYCDIQPNPARSHKVKLPSAVVEEPNPPSGAEWSKMKGQITNSTVLLVFRVLEATGLRIGEALKVVWGDVDFVSGQLRISSARTKGRTAGRRWLPVPPELLDEIADLLPLEDRARDRRVFAGLTYGQLGRVLDRACRDAGLADYTPHDLRHRRISLWFAHQLDQVTIATWAGHSRPSMSSDRYGHVLISTDDEWREFWVQTYRRDRLPRAVTEPVRGAVVTPQEQGD